ncbi:MAG TPA: hypothetical protein VG387_12820 [Rhizomicrobium sp.]|jgi:hypothetical protein|nr:hypothetical protein [Rhizomicrobium sp.]
MTTKNAAIAQLVPAEAYPPLLSPLQRRQAMAKLRSAETIAKASRILAARAAELRDAVLELVAQFEEAMAVADWPMVYSATHEIRGLAATAGLGATGRIANVFCHYLDAVAQLGLAPETAIAKVHLNALVRSARTEDDTARHGDMVAQELSALVARKLAELKDSSTMRDGLRDGAA